MTHDPPSSPKKGLGRVFALAMGVGAGSLLVLGALLIPTAPCACTGKVESTGNSLRGGIAQGLAMYHRRHGAYPEAKQGLRALVDEKILDSLPTDGWGNELIYEVPIPGRYRLVSYGGDGAPGGTGSDKELVFEGPAARDAI